MEIHETEQKNVFKGIEESIEAQTGKKIFTMCVISEIEDENDTMEVLAVFTDKSIANLEIGFGEQDGKLALRIRGNFL